MIRKLASGLYTWSPLGLRVLRKVERIVREEMDRAGAVEFQIPTIQPKELWEQTGRWQKFGPQLLNIKDRKDQVFCYSPTAEEAACDFARSELSSYKQLPVNFYQVQTKFRDEIRPRFGVMRSREFLMKDAYSFDLDYEGAKMAYYRMFVSYLRTFARVGLQAIPMRADTGPIGGDLSHEFIILAETGESQVFCDKAYLDLAVPGADTDFRNDAQLTYIVSAETPYAATDEMHDEADWAKVKPEDQVSARGIEVGHIFHFGTKYSEPMGAKVQGPDGKEHLVSMGSYGIGPSRLVAAAIEAFHDDAGIIWPKASRLSVPVSST
jgi:prolyl-tRNA synthetase